MEETFFAENTRRECILVGASTLNREEEKRIKFALRIPLTGQSLVGMPEWMGNAHDAVAKTVTSATLDVSYKGMNINVFATDRSDRELQIPSAILSKFNVARSGGSEDPDVDLNFIAIAPFNTRAWKWAGELTGMHFFAKFESAQQELPVDGKAAAAAGDDDDDVDDGEGEADNQPSLLSGDGYASENLPKRRALSNEARKRIADAQKKRWAKALKAKSKAK